MTLQFNENMACHFCPYLLCRPCGEIPVPPHFARRGAPPSSDPPRCSRSPSSSRRPAVPAPSSRRCQRPSSRSTHTHRVAGRLHALLVGSFCLFLDVVYAMAVAASMPRAMAHGGSCTAALRVLCFSPMDKSKRSKAGEGLQDTVAVTQPLGGQAILESRGVRG